MQRGGKSDRREKEKKRENRKGEEKREDRKKQIQACWIRLAGEASHFARGMAVCHCRRGCCRSNRFFFLYMSFSFIFFASCVFCVRESKMVLHALPSHLPQGQGCETSLLLFVTVSSSRFVFGLLCVCLSRSHWPWAITVPASTAAPGQRRRSRHKQKRLHA
ncbi:hypothetical protein V8C44DRAFT_320227 [Trichoderma aethiopicum]